MKLIRIIISPFFFVIEMIGLVLIPIGIISFILGFFVITYKLLMSKKIDEKDVYMTFCIVTLPYFDTAKFIKGEF